jgi:hypothetical protein
MPPATAPDLATAMHMALADGSTLLVAPEGRVLGVLVPWANYRRGETAARVTPEPAPIPAVLTAPGPGLDELPRLAGAAPGPATAAVLAEAEPARRPPPEPTHAKARTPTTPAADHP